MSTNIAALPGPHVRALTSRAQRNSASDRVKPKSTYVEIAVVVWVLLALSSKLNSVYLPYIDWLSTPILLAPIIRNAQVFRRPALPTFYSAGLLLVIMALTTLTNGLEVRHMLQAGKLFITLFFVYPVFASLPQYSRLAMRAAALATVINATLLVFGRLGIPGLAEPYGDGRWTTVLNHVGALAFLGLLTFGYGAYACLHSKDCLFWYGLVTLSSVYLVLSDGSRTGALCLALLSGYIACTALSRKPSARKAKIRLTFTLVSGACLYLVSAIGNSADPFASLLHGRVMKLGNGEGGGFEDRLRETDVARFEVILVALDRISTHPLWGAGLETTQVIDDGAIVEVHNAYLQSWADLGLFGFLGFAGVSLWWVPRLRRVLKLVSSTPDVANRVFYHGAITGLASFSFVCLYHPMSVEITDWIRFIVPSAIFFQILNPANDKRSASDRRLCGRQALCSPSST